MRKAIKEIDVCVHIDDRTPDKDLSIQVAGRFIISVAPCDLCLITLMCKNNSL